MTDAFMWSMTVLPIGLTVGLLIGHVITVRKFRRYYEYNLRLQAALKPFAELTIEGMDPSVAGYPVIAKRVSEARKVLEEGNEG
jgi:hypothetical protein